MSAARADASTEGHEHGALLGAPARADFPILAQLQNDTRLVYLDSAATSQKPTCVIDAISAYYREDNANIHRSAFDLAERATEAFEGARSRVAALLGSTPEETIFTRNATEAINLVSHSWGLENVTKDDVVLITQMEHHSNIVPWQMLCRETGAELDYVDITDEGLLDQDDLTSKLARGNVKLLAVAHISNVLGTINDVNAIVKQARAAGTKVLVDGSQAVPQLPVDVSAIDADFYVWTGHKAYGPTGIGVLHGRREILTEMRPWLGGGDMIKTVNWNDSTWNDLPWKFEAGTSAIAEGVGLGAAIDYIERIGPANIRAHEHRLTAYALPLLREIPGLTVVGPDADHRGGVISFTVESMHPHDVGELLNRDAVCVRTGHHCAQPLMRRLNIAATARASFGVFNDTDDVDALVASLHRARGVFGL